LEKGKKYRCETKNKGLWAKTFIGKVVEEHPRFYVLQCKNYKTCIMKADIENKDYKVKAI